MSNPSDVIWGLMHFCSLNLDFVIPPLHDKYICPCAEALLAAPGALRGQMRIFFL